MVTFLGQIPGQMWEYANTSVTYDMVHDTHDTHDTYSQDSWSHFWDKFLGRCGNTQIHVLHMIDMVQRERERERERERGARHIFGANSSADVGIRKYICCL